MLYNWVIYYLGYTFISILFYRKLNVRWKNYVLCWDFVTSYFQYIENNSCQNEYKFLLENLVEYYDVMSWVVMAEQQQLLISINLKAHQKNHL